MVTYVLLHGAMAGGWQWREVASLLRAAGHEVHTPTLTGLGERSHLLRPDIDLDTHINDVLGVLRYEELDDVILVGKSYSGIVVTGVADRAPERIRHVVYLDAIVPRDGESFVDLAGPEVAPHIMADVEARGDGWRLPVDTAANPRLTDHPFKTLTQRVEAGNPEGAALPRTYIKCTAQAPGTMHARVTAQAAERARAEGWSYRELPTGHDPEREMPQAVADLLLELA